MRKNELKVCILSAVFIALLCLSFAHKLALDKLQNEADKIAAKRVQFIQLHQRLSDLSLNLNKNRSELLRKTPNLRHSILNIAKKSDVQKVALKIIQNSFKTYNAYNVSMQFESPSENNIYKFLNSLRSKFNVIFDSIKISQKQTESDNLKVDLECTCIEFTKIDENITFKPLKKSNLQKESKEIKKIHLFDNNTNKQKHTLKGIINGSKAFIDNGWKQIGDSVDETEIKAIFNDSIMLENQESLDNIKIGNKF